MSDFLLSARLLLAIVFAVAGLAKLMDAAGSRKSLREFGVPQRLVPVFSLSLPALELACAVALLRVYWVWWGAITALALLVVFVGAIGFNLMRGRRPDCHCFGQLHSSPVGWTTLFRNGGLVVLAALVATNGPGTSVVDVIGRLGRTNSLPLVLTVGLVGLWAFVLAALYQMLRQNGRMLRRLEAIEAKLGIPEEQLHPAGLPVKSAAPGFNLVNVDGRLVTSEMLRQRGKPLLLFFSEPNCSACEAMLPDVARWQREHEDHLVVVLVSRGDAEANRIKSRVHDLQNVLLQRDREVAEAYGVVATPSAVLVTDGLIASPLAIGPEFIGALVRDATTPPPLDRGDRVPSLELRDLNQGSMDLAALEGHRTLLLFWNPSCGFCDKMLDDVKAWECDRPPGAPDLVVISTGSPKANREQGFRSRVLLDPNFRAGNVFGATGTPSALMIDENGRVASEVVTGAPAVLALVGAAPAAARVRRK